MSGMVIFVQSYHSTIAVKPDLQYKREATVASIIQRLSLAGLDPARFELIYDASSQGHPRPGLMIGVGTKIGGADLLVLHRESNKVVAVAILTMEDDRWTSILGALFSALMADTAGGSGRYYEIKDAVVVVGCITLTPTGAQEVARKVMGRVKYAVDQEARPQVADARLVMAGNAAEMIQKVTDELSAALV
jgi:hypothetical protein